LVIKGSVIGSGVYSGVSDGRRDRWNGSRSERRRRNDRKRVDHRDGDECHCDRNPHRKRANVPQIVLSGSTSATVEAQQLLLHRA
jgi:hypothetical protein